MGHIVNKTTWLFFAAVALAFCISDERLLGRFIQSDLRFPLALGCFGVCFLGIFQYALFASRAFVRRLAGDPVYFVQPSGHHFNTLLLELKRMKDHSVDRRVVWRVMKSSPIIELLKKDSGNECRVMTLMLQYPSTFREEILDVRRMMLDVHVQRMYEILDRASSDPQNRELHITAAFQELLRCMWFHEPPFSRRLLKDFIRVLRSLDAEQQGRVLSVVVSEQLTTPSYFTKTGRDQEVRKDYLHFVEMIKVGLEVEQTA